MGKIKSILSIVTALVLVMNMCTFIVKAEDTYDIFPFQTELIDVNSISDEYSFKLRLSLIDELKAVNKDYKLEISNSQGLSLFEGTFSAESVQIFDWMVKDEVYSFSAIMDDIGIMYSGKISLCC